MTCNNCENTISSESKFCRFCGTEIEGTSHDKNRLSYMGRLFKTRINRKNYILGILAVYAVYLILMFSIGFAAESFGIALSESGVDVIAWLGYLVVVFYVISLVIRRVHDFDKSGWFILWCIIPLVGWIISIYILFKEGDEKKNKYGASPQKNLNLNETFAL